MSDRTPDPAMHLPQHCPACFAPIRKWEGATAHDDGDGDPEDASYECGLALIYYSDDGAKTTRVCGRAYDVAVKLRREATARLTCPKCGHTAYGQAVTP